MNRILLKKSTVILFLVILFSLSGCKSMDTTSDKNIEQDQKESVFDDCQAEPTEKEDVGDKTITFIPDYTPGNDNIAGNSNQNLSQGGFIAGQDGWAYFSLGSNILYKCPTDNFSPENIIQISDHPEDGEIQYINVCGDWVYYKVYIYQGGMQAEIKKIRTDGSLEQSLTNDAWYNGRIMVYDHQLYYTEYTQVSASEWKKHLAILNADTGEKMFVASDETEFRGIWNNRIYAYYDQYDVQFLNERIALENKNKEHYGFSYNLDGSDQSWLTKDGVIYADGVKIKTGYSGYDSGEEYTLHWARVGNTLFYKDVVKSDYSRKYMGIWKMDLDGENCMLVNQDEPSWLYSIGDGYLYYSTNVEGHTLYRIREDGSGWEDLGTLRNGLSE